IDAVGVKLHRTVATRSIDAAVVMTTGGDVLLLMATAILGSLCPEAPKRDFAGSRLRSLQRQGNALLQKAVANVVDPLSVTAQCIGGGRIWRIPSSKDLPS